MNYVEKTLANKPTEAQLGGIPTVDNKIRAFLNVKYYKNGSWNGGVEVSSPFPSFSKIILIEFRGRLRILNQSGPKSTTSCDLVIWPKRCSMSSTTRERSRFSKRTLLLSSALGCEKVEGEPVLVAATIQAGMLMMRIPQTTKIITIPIPNRIQHETPLPAQGIDRSVQIRPLQADWTTRALSKKCRWSNRNDGRLDLVPTRSRGRDDDWRRWCDGWIPGEV